MDRRSFMSSLSALVALPVVDKVAPCCACDDGPWDVTLEITDAEGNVEQCSQVVESLFVAGWYMVMIDGVWEECWINQEGDVWMLSKNDNMPWLFKCVLPHGEYPMEPCIPKNLDRLGMVL